MGAIFDEISDEVHLATNNYLNIAEQRWTEKIDKFHLSFFLGKNVFWWSWFSNYVCLSVQWVGYFLEIKTRI